MGQFLAEVVGFPKHLIGDLSHLSFSVFHNNENLGHYKITPFSLMMLQKNRPSFWQGTFLLERNQPAKKPAHLHFFFEKHWQN